MQKDGEDVPALRDRPKLPGRLRYYQNIFQEISDSRPYSASGTPLPVPMSEFKAYFEVYRIMGLDERERIISLVKSMDRLFIKHISEQMEADRKSKNAVA